MHWIFHESPLSGRMLSILRIVAGIIFVSFGTMKLFGYPPSPTPIGPVDLNSELGIAGMLEVCGGFAIVFGLLTRPIAFVDGIAVATLLRSLDVPDAPDRIVARWAREAPAARGRKILDWLWARGILEAAEHR